MKYCVFKSTKLARKTQISHYHFIMELHKYEQIHEHSFGTNTFYKEVEKLKFKRKDVIIFTDFAAIDLPSHGHVTVPGLWVDSDVTGDDRRIEIIRHNCVLVGVSCEDALTVVFVKDIGVRRTVNAVCKPI